MGEALQGGMLVKVLEAFTSDDVGNHELKAGQNGVVLRIGKDGDANIDFEGIEKSTWVFKKNFHRLEAVPQAFNTGDTVEAHSLNEVAMNGKWGKVIGFFQDGLVQVEFPGVGGQALKPWKLRLMEAHSTSCPNGHALEDYTV